MRIGREGMIVVLLGFSGHDEYISVGEWNVKFWVDLVVSCLVCGGYVGFENKVTSGSKGNADDDGVVTEFWFIVRVIIDFLLAISVAIDEVATNGNGKAKKFGNVIG